MARASARARGWTCCWRCAVRPWPGPRSAPLLSAEVPAVEARRLLVEALQGDGGPSSCGELTVAQDAVRLAAGVVDGAVLERLAEGAGWSEEALAAAVRAWRVGGADGLAVWDEEWSVSGEALARARAALEAPWEADERPVLPVSRRAGGRSSEAAPSCVWGATGAGGPTVGSKSVGCPRAGLRGTRRPRSPAVPYRATMRPAEVRAERWAGRTVRMLGPPTACAS